MPSLRLHGGSRTSPPSRYAYQARRSTSPTFTIRHQLTFELTYRTHLIHRTLRGVLSLEYGNPQHKHPPAMSGARHWEQDKEATVYIGNLDERVTDAIVWELMLQAGRIVRYATLCLLSFVFSFPNPLFSLPHAPFSSSGPRSAQGQELRANSLDE